MVFKTEVITGVLEPPLNRPAQVLSTVLSVSPASWAVLQLVEDNFTFVFVN